MNGNGKEDTGPAVFVARDIPKKSNFDNQHAVRLLSDFTGDNRINPVIQSLTVVVVPSEEEDGLLDGRVYLHDEIINQYINSRGGEALAADLNNTDYISKGKNKIEQIALTTLKAKVHEFEKNKAEGKLALGEKAFTEDEYKDLRSRLFPCFRKMNNTSIEELYTKLNNEGGILKFTSSGGRGASGHAYLLYKDQASKKLYIISSSSFQDDEKQALWYQLLSKRAQKDGFTLDAVVKNRQNNDISCILCTCYTEYLLRKEKEEQRSLNAIPQEMNEETENALMLGTYYGLRPFYRDKNEEELRDNWDEDTEVPPQKRAWAYDGAVRLEVNEIDLNARKELKRALERKDKNLPGSLEDAGKDPFGLEASFVFIPESVDADKKPPLQLKNKNANPPSKPIVSSIFGQGSKQQDEGKANPLVDPKASSFESKQPNAINGKPPLHPSVKEGAGKANPLVDPKASSFESKQQDADKKPSLQLKNKNANPLVDPKASSFESKQPNAINGKPPLHPPVKQNADKANPPSKPIVSSIFGQGSKQQDEGKANPLVDPKASSFFIEDPKNNQYQTQYHIDARGGPLGYELYTINSNSNAAIRVHQSINKSFTHQEIISKMSTILATAIQRTKAKYLGHDRLRALLGSDDFIKHVIAFAQKNKGVGNAGLGKWIQFQKSKHLERPSDKEEEGEAYFVLARELSRQYQKAAKENSFLTGRTENVKKPFVGQRLFRIPEDDTSSIVAGAMAQEKSASRAR